MFVVNKKQLLLLLMLLTTLLPFVTAPAALLAGIAFGLFFGNPWVKVTSAWSKRLLQLSVTGLGFGLSIEQIWHTGRETFVYTILGIAVTIFLGLMLGRVYRANHNVSALIAFGTAICGGSAIAAMAPVIKSRDDETAVSLATVFTLNSVALLLFPWVGQLLHLSQRQFGLWAALAIHDTSSVVGAAAVYGSTALAIATTVKLARAVWIAPIALGTAWVKKSGDRAKLPVFIIGFIAAALLRSIFPSLAPLWHILMLAAKQLLVVTLFLVGTGLTRAVLKNVGARPLLLGVTLWVVISSATLAAILSNLIR